MAPPPAGVNGILPVAVLQKNAPAQTPRGPKAALPRLKLICRRLPPGLTEAEFKTMLGDEWQSGAGRVDWVNYRMGKISKDAAKPSRPARVYLHVTKHDYVKMLGDRVRDTTFHDAARTWQDAALVGPPVVEYAAYPKMPGGRRRNDNRQGTIDQDQEFKDFLESLTNPIIKPSAPDTDAQKQDKVKTTPLIEALREKKANKEKPNSKSNRHARGEGKEEISDKKATAKSTKDNSSGAGDKSKRAAKADKAKEAVKILNKEAASAKDVASSATAEKLGASPAPERKRGNVSGVKSLLQRDLGLGAAAPTRRRGTKREVASTAGDTINQAKNPASVGVEQKTKDISTTTAAPVAPSSADKINQPQKKERPTRAERRAFKAALTDKSNEKTQSGEGKAQISTKSNTPTPQILKKPAAPVTATAQKNQIAPRAPAIEPVITKSIASPAQAKAASAKPASNPSAAHNTHPPPINPVPAATSKQAFLKHANPSQGITEPLIEESLKVFGGVERVEIDKRKGFAYVDFTEPQGLQNAMAASPIKIAQGAVQVLERKEKITRAPNPRFAGPVPVSPARGGHAGRGGFAPRGRGGRGGARAGGHAPISSTTGSDSISPTSPASTATATSPGNSGPVI